MELQQHVWGDEPLASNAVDSAICCLRKKLADVECPELIDTKRGVGYRLTVPAGA
jgi:DNA-binding response OmpR family regulator